MTIALVVTLLIACVVIGLLRSGSTNTRGRRDLLDNCQEDVNAYSAGRINVPSVGQYSKKLPKPPSKKKLKPIAAIVAGTHFYDEEFIRGSCHPRTVVHLRREPSNRYDSNAIGVHVESRQIGHLKAGLARRLAPRMDRGDSFQSYIASMYISPDRGFNRVTLAITQIVR